MVILKWVQKEHPFYPTLPDIRLWMNMMAIKKNKSDSWHYISPGVLAANPPALH
jgi:hypothetical protein